MSPRVYTRQPIAERFWSKVDKSGDCWLWTASINGAGYGQIGTEQSRPMMGAHRLAWELAFGPIPEGQFVCHRCDVKRCVNPAHLFLGAPADNTRDMYAKGRAAMGDRHPARYRSSYLPRGERHPNAKLTDLAVTEIRQRYAAGAISQRALAAEYGVSEMIVNGIVRGRSWRHVP